MNRRTTKKPTPNHSTSNKNNFEMNRLKSYILLLLITASGFVKADEGMWLPILLKKYNIEDMKAKGFKLTAEDIYSVNKASMKDAVVIFGGGCTGELISDQGLLITNHHCGYGQIQAHSSLEHDYLTNGFWAMNKSEELVNPGLSVRFLVRMEDVTSTALKGVDNKMNMADRQKVIKKNIEKIEEKATKDTHYTARVEKFYHGNEYYLFVEEMFTDVRLVGAPPSAIGKFGGDTDNWMWPRHTGDFSIFRIYANKKNQPAEYSPDNVPYKPKKHFPVSLKGIKKDDFTMVFGFPGRTQEYLPASAVKLITETSNPHKIRIRQTKIDIIGRDMNADPKTRIQYSAKYARISNSWKKWIGENRGLRKLNALEKKAAYETKFQTWAESNDGLRQQYANLLPTFNKAYEEIKPYWLARDYYREAGLYLDLMEFGWQISNLARSMEEDKKKEFKKKRKGMVSYAEKFYKDFNLDTDKAVFLAMIKLWVKNVEEAKWPAALQAAKTTHNGNWNAYVNDMYSKTVFTQPEKMKGIMEKFSKKKLEELSTDPMFRFFASLASDYYQKIMPQYRSIHYRIDSLQMVYMRGMREMEKERTFYPDANFTLRVTYGKVDGYRPNNAVIYEHQTTLEGIMEKDNPEIYDYNVPQRLRDLFKSKDYGQYADNGKLPVCFIATNHTTGGNSGSPVIDGEGNLIGVNFDRSWESTMSDIMYDPDQCRNITLDIRYALFIIDKFAGAKHLVDEMTIVK